MLAGQRAGQVTGDEAVHDLHLADVPGRLERSEEHTSELQSLA